VGNYTEITSAGTHLSSSPRDVYGGDRSDTELVRIPKYEGPGINKEVKVTFKESDLDIEEEFNARWYEMSEGGSGHGVARPGVSHGKLQKVHHHR
jgi:hypothetical protein